MQKDAVVAGGRFEKSDELALGCLQRRVRHVVDKADSQDRIGRALSAIEFTDGTRLPGRQSGADRQRMLLEQDAHPGLRPRYSAASSR